MTCPKHWWLWIHHVNGCTTSTCILRVTPDTRCFKERTLSRILSLTKQVKTHEILCHPCRAPIRKTIVYWDRTVSSLRLSVNKMWAAHPTDADTSPDTTAMRADTSPDTTAMRADTSPDTTAMRADTLQIPHLFQHLNIPVYVAHRRFCWSISFSSWRNCLMTFSMFSLLRATCFSMATLKSSFTPLFTPRVTVLCLKCWGNRHLVMHSEILDISLTDINT